MKTKLVHKPLVIFASFVLVVSLACNLTTSVTPTPEPTPTQPVVREGNPPPEPTATVASVQEEPLPVKKNVVTGLENVKEAMVFINVEGTWRDPEGLQQNVGYLGTGFIIDPSGIAVTNNHVVTGAALIKVYVGDEDKPRSAKVLGVSECSDLAVIDIEGDGFPYFEWSDQEVKVGTKVYAVGYPGGLYTLTDGIISATDVPGRTAWSSVNEVLQHTAKINPGNSGGPLITEDGKVIGVNYASLSSADRNFSISPTEALPIIEKLRTGTDVDSIGINGVTLVDYTDEQGNPLYGIWVRSVKPGSPADKARLQPGDILYSISGQVLATDGTLGDYCDILRSHSSVDTVDIEVIRYDTMELLAGQLNGRELETSANLGNQIEGEDQTLTETGSYGEYIAVQDSYGSIQVELPTAWVEMDGSPWQYDGETIGASIMASANLDAFYNGWEESGIYFAVTNDIAKLAGYIQLLDSISLDYRDECNYEGRTDYEDAVYRGKYDLLSGCGGADNIFMILSAVPKENSTSMLILVEMVLTKDADFDALDHILNSFDVIGSLP